MLSLIEPRAVRKTNEETEESLTRFSALVSLKIYKKPLICLFSGQCISVCIYLGQKNLTEESGPIFSMVTFPLTCED